ncbi:glycosyltransferase family 4 protein [Flexithrix dorotheae]|uniref:glycosyltransferase family 4 protein n=1 Tax=Flexithrix dorotheae TaxID=70993 RepID=UPI00036B4D41|nr:glycosyltransferase family 4 protein [Flexithrix dorotheae]
MTNNLNHKALYAAFDLYPSAKGAATHISHFSQALFEHYNGGLLYVLGNEKLPTYQQEGNIEIVRFSEAIPNYLERAESYVRAFQEELENHQNLELCHFRDIWSGLAILQQKRSYQTVFEVNGLPSIELPFKYSYLSESTLGKIRQLEDFCMEKADAIVTPSNSIKSNLINRGIPAEKITVIYNGAEIPGQLERPFDAPEKYLIYFGALQKWQGVDVLLKAFAGLRDYKDLKLVICSSNRAKFAKPFKKFVEKLELSESIIWHAQLAKEELYRWVQHAEISIAPLKECSRNLIQGCCPLKVLESMACRTAVVASDIPAVRELVKDRENGKLVKADRPAELSRALRFLLDYPEERQRLATGGFENIRNNFTWDQKKDELKAFYSQLISVI